MEIDGQSNKVSLRAAGIIHRRLNQEIKMISVLDQPKPQTLGSFALESHLFRLRNIATAFVSTVSSSNTCPLWTRNSLNVLDMPDPSPSLRKKESEFGDQDAIAGGETGLKLKEVTMPVKRI